MSPTMMMSLFPVEVTKISAVGKTEVSFLTSNPSMAAYKAQIGSISVTTTLAPQFFMAEAQPFPTSPYPHTTTYFPAIITSVALMIPSGRECLHP